ncbi:MAG: CopG family transcriptional regulator [Eubacteriales bacterium]
MSKSVYSLILSDEVVAAVDRLAYQKGLSRSAMVNELLASAVSCVTPEMWVRQILDRLDEGLSDGVFLPVQSGGTAYSVRSRLVYKYNPSLRFSIELSKAALPEIGWLKVGLRSRSDQLILLLLDFFELWQTVESAYCPDAKYAVRDGRLERELVLREPTHPNPTPKVIGDSIVAYINLLNNAIGSFFEQSCDKSLAVSPILSLCDRYYRRQDVLRI